MLTNLIFLTAITNLPPCSIVETSIDLTNWYPSFKLQRLDGSTNIWKEVTVGINPTNRQQFWRIKVCN